MGRCVMLAQGNIAAIAVFFLPPFKGEVPSAARGKGATRVETPLRLTR
jgi:hypothetical protein